MGRPRKPGFRNPKMFSSRVEHSDFVKFEYIFKKRDKKKLQEIINLFVVNYISGTIVLAGDKFIEGHGEDLEKFWKIKGEQQ